MHVKKKKKRQEPGMGHKLSNVEFFFLEILNEAKEDYATLNY
jgi:hypothetical protein